MRSYGDDDDGFIVIVCTTYIQEIILNHHIPLFVMLGKEYNLPSFLYIHNALKCMR